MDDDKKLVGTPHPSSGEKPNSEEPVRGKVHVYSDAVKSGVIRVENKEYLFSRKDWLSEQDPAVDLLVVFTPQGNWARSIKIAE
jgi:hypothetical protein